MIEIRVDTKRLKLKVTGHATPEECEDHTIVCNSASVLAQGLAWTCKKFAEEKQAAQKIQYRADPGDLFLMVIPEGWAEPVFRQRFRTYADGLECLAQNRPESVTMIIDGRRVLPEKEGKA